MTRRDLGMMALGAVLMGLLIAVLAEAAYRYEMARILG